MHETAWLVTVFFLSLLWSGLGTAIGYHRGLSHRSYTSPKFVEYFFVLGAIMGFQGSPIWWTTIHRAHHRYSDTELDSHSPRHGFKFWDYRWFLKPSYAVQMDPKQQCPDLYKDSLYRFLECDGDWVKAQWLNFFGIAVLGRALLIPIFGWKVAAVSLLAGVAFFQMPLIFNYICHLPQLGYRTYATTDDSVNVWWVGLLWFGEGWHNNHHAFPAAARAGVRPHEFDISWAILSMLKKVGLVHRLNDVTPEQLRRLEKRYNPAVSETEAIDGVPLAPAFEGIQISHVLEDNRVLSLT